MADPGPGDPATPAHTPTGRSMAAHSVVYVIGTALQGLGVLLIVPFATRLLGDAEFGRVATGLVAVQMVGTIAAAGLPQVILREQHRGADGPLAARALAGVMTLAALALAVLGSALVLGLDAAHVLERDTWLPVVLASSALTVVVGGQTLMRARMRPGGFFVLAVASTVLAHLAGVLAARSAPTAGAYLTAYTAVLAAVALGAVVLGRPALPRVAPERTRAGIRLAAPLLPQAVAMLGLLMGDVLLVRLLLGPAATGNYQVALQLGNMAFVLSTALFNAWSPLVLSHPIGERWSFTARTGTAMTILVGVGALGVALLGPWLLALFAAPSFDHPMMVHALGLLVGVAPLYMLHQGGSLAVLDAERTGRLAVSALAALAVMVVSAVGLVMAFPTVGISGVAAGKLLGYATLAAATTSYAYAHSPLRWPPALAATVAGAVVGGIGAGSFLPVSGWGAVARISLTALLAGGALLAAPRLLRLVRA